MQPRRRPIPVLAALALLTALPAAAQPALTERAQPGTEPPGFHGMLVLGSETIYASHLPMFSPQHRYQGIWQVSFGASGDAEYRAERAKPANARARRSGRPGRPVPLSPRPRASAVRRQWP